MKSSCNRFTLLSFYHAFGMLSIYYNIIVNKKQALAVSFSVLDEVKKREYNKAY